MLASLSGAVLATRQEQPQQQLLKACLHPGPRNHLSPRVYRAQMTRDFAADLAEVFWHMTWDLCIDFAMVFFFTHDMGVMRRPNGQVFFNFFDR